jgi:hypothetical protein
MSRPNIGRIDYVGAALIASSIAHAYLIHRLRKGKP